MPDSATLTTWLSEAYAARHKLMTGAQAVRIRHGDEEWQFTPASLSDLDAYIASLLAQLGSTEGASRRRPINFTY